MPDAFQDQKMALNPLSLELQKIVNCHVGTRNQIPEICKENARSTTPSPFLCFDGRFDILLRSFIPSSVVYHQKLCSEQGNGGYLYLCVGNLMSNGNISQIHHFNDILNIL